MFVVIAGGGRTGAHLAKMLININHRVCVIDHRKDVLARLHRELPTEVILDGNPLDVVVLEEAGLREADVFAAITAVDSENLTLCYLARERFQVDRTIARVNNPRNAWLFNERFKVDVALNQADILSGLIAEEMSMGDMMTLLKIRRGNYSLVEEKIPHNAMAVGMAIQDLNLPMNCVIAGIIRNGKLVIPRGPTTLFAEDEVLAIADVDGAKAIADLFYAPKEKKPLTDKRG